MFISYCAIGSGSELICIKTLGLNTMHYISNLMPNGKLYQLNKRANELGIRITLSEKRFESKTACENDLIDRLEKAINAHLRVKGNELMSFTIIGKYKDADLVLNAHNQLGLGFKQGEGQYYLANLCDPNPTREDSIQDQLEEAYQEICADLEAKTGI